MIAGILPIDLQIEKTNEIKKIKNCELKENEKRKKIKEMQQKYMKVWQQRYDNENTGRRTYKLIPNIEERIKNKNLLPDYYFTQFLTGHGNFGEYLKRFKLTNNDKCQSCKKKVIDTPDHTFQNCHKFKNMKKKYNIKDSHWFLNPETTKNTIDYVNCLMKKKEKT